MNYDELKTFEAALNAAIEDGEVLDAYQVAADLGNHHNGILLAAKKGKIRCVRFGRTYLFTPDTVKEWRDSLKYTRK